MANTVDPASNLQLTRKQLDDLDVLVKKMLELPEANAPSSVPPNNEPDLSAMGIFSPEENPWTPKKTESTKVPETSEPKATKTSSLDVEQKPEILKSILSRGIQKEPNPSFGIEEPPSNNQNSSPLAGWKPSALTWAPLAQSWEKLKLEELEKQQKETKPRSTHAEANEKLKTETASNPWQSTGIPSTTDTKKPLKPLPKSELKERKKTSKFKRVLLDAVGFLGILIFVCAAALYLSSSFNWPIK